jgi:hypothetical protein
MVVDVLPETDRLLVSDRFLYVDYRLGFAQKGDFC